MGNFLNQAAKHNTDIKGFLKDAIGGNSIKYSAEKGASHVLYICYKMGEKSLPEGGTEPIKELVAISGSIHDWTTPDNRYRSTVCLKDVFRKTDEGHVINDGSCPFCDRVNDSWDIFRYRKEAEERNCKLVGEDRKKHIEKINTSFADERKTKDPRPYIYLLVAKFKMNGNAPVIGTDGLPEYDLKVMKLSSARSDKMQQTVENSGLDFAGSEIMISYPNTEDLRQVTSQSVIAPVFPGKAITDKYPAVKDKITQDVAAFEWDGIEKSFPEWAGMASDEAVKTTDKMFENWDKYKQQKELNPSAMYMEYLNETPVTNPSLSGAETATGVATAPTIPGAPTVPGAPLIPGATTTPIANIPAPDVNAVFGGNPTGIQL